MKYVDGGICAAKGYKASGTYCGIKKPNVENFDPNVKHKNNMQCGGCLHQKQSKGCAYSCNKSKFGKKRK